MTVAKFGALKSYSSCNVIVYMRTGVISQFLIFPLEVALDRDQNQKYKIHFWATCCTGSIKMDIRGVNLQVKSDISSQWKKSFNTTLTLGLAALNKIMHRSGLTKNLALPKICFQ